MANRPGSRHGLAMPRHAAADVIAAALDLAAVRNRLFGQMGLHREFLHRRGPLYLRAFPGSAVAASVLHGHTIRLCVCHGAALGTGPAGPGHWPRPGTRLSSVLGIFYCLGIAGAYFFGRVPHGIEKSGLVRRARLRLDLAGFLLVKNFRADSQFWEPIRLGVLLRYGEGPHSSSITCLLFALAFGWRAHARRTGGSISRSQRWPRHSPSGTTFTARRRSRSCTRCWPGVSASPPAGGVLGARRRIPAARVRPARLLAHAFLHADHPAQRAVHCRPAERMVALARTGARVIVPRHQRWRLGRRRRSGRCPYSSSGRCCS